MLKGLQYHFDRYPPEPNGLDAIAAIGVRVVRCSLPSDQIVTAYDASAIAKRVLLHGLIPLVIVNESAQVTLLPPGTHVEVINEPQLNGWMSRPGAYRDLVLAVRALAPAGVTVWAGGPANLKEEDLDWLASTRPDLWPDTIGVAVHRYAPDQWFGNSQLTPHDGYATRDDEIAALKTIIGARAWGVSEFGYHTAPRGLFGWSWLKVLRWSDDDVKRFVSWEWAFWQRHGAVAACLYQIADGPTGEPINRFGIRRYDGTWKPVSETFREQTP